MLNIVNRKWDRSIKCCSNLFTNYENAYAQRNCVVLRNCRLIVEYLRHALTIFKYNHQSTKFMKQHKHLGAIKPLKLKISNKLQL